MNKTLLVSLMLIISIFISGAEPTLSKSYYATFVLDTAFNNRINEGFIVTCDDKIINADWDYDTIKNCYCKTISKLKGGVYNLKHKTILMKYWMIQWLFIRIHP